MMKWVDYFFVYEDELPEGVGFSMFGPAHLLWLFFCAAFTVCFLKCYRKWTKQRKEKADCCLGCFPVFLILLRTYVLFLIGKLSVYELPLHMCSLAGFLCCLHVFRKWDWLEQTLYTLCLPGVMLALIFPDGLYYPPIHFITVESFLFHGTVALYIVCQLSSGKIRPRLSALWKVVVFLLLIVPPVYVFDKKFHANYMFLNGPSSGSPLEWMAAVMGNPGYLWGYGAAIAACMVFMDAGYYVVAGRKK